jgi:choline dehydrogenase-like flavoprotein
VTAMIFEIDPSVPAPDDWKADLSLAKEAEIAYATSQSGPFTILPRSISYAPVSLFKSPEYLNSIVFGAIPSNVSRSLKDDILAQKYSSDMKVGQVEFIFDVGNWSPFFPSAPGKKYGTVLQMLQYPFSKGSIHIPPKSSSGPPTSDNKPIIDPQYYGGKGGQVDFEIMVAAQKFADKICRTAPLSNITGARAFPPEREITSEAEEDFSDFVRTTTITDWHPVGTCSMGGKEGIKGGVVDARLRVYGVKGLRVIDASIMPLHVCSHPQATIYAIGEKGASMILEDCKK